VLALALGRTIAELQSSMTAAEFNDWVAFYNRWPFDDFHRFHRPAALIAGSLGGGGNDGMEKRLEWLQPGGGDDDGRTNADRDLLRAAGVKVGR
jgi:hypothetical protein